jgi:hypothetical protein
MLSYNTFPSKEIDESTICNLANPFKEVSFYMWEEILNSSAKMSLFDLGFDMIGAE